MGRGSLFRPGTTWLMACVLLIAPEISGSVTLAADYAWEASQDDRDGPTYYYPTEARAPTRTNEGRHDHVTRSVVQPQEEWEAEHLGEGWETWCGSIRKGQKCEAPVCKDKPHQGCVSGLDDWPR